MEIPVVFATDENYLFYTVTAITSIAESAEKTTFYQIYILVSGGLQKGHYLFSDLQAKYANIKIDLLPVKEYEFQNAHINNAHVTKATFYRLLLSELLYEDKCLYLDSDIVVNRDLQELYLTEMGDDYVAGVRDLWIDLLEETDREKRRARTGIPSMDQYVNAGVLLLNLKKIRENHIEKAFRDHIGINYLYEDQDIVNVCCYDHIRRLPAKWNLFTSFMGQLDKLKQNGVDKDTIRYMEEKRGILHYATPFMRPWESERFLCNDIWWKYASVWSETLEYQTIRKRMCQHEIGYSQEAMARYCMEYEKIYIWGFTKMGRELFTELLQKGINNIVCFIDKDTEKQKFTYCEKRVQPFDTEICRQKKRAFIIAGQKRGKEIREFLIDKGIKEKDIVRYIYKDTTYYQCVRPEYREEEGEK